MTVNILTKHYAAFLTLQDMANQITFPERYKIYEKRDLNASFLESVYGDHYALTDCQTQAECDAFRRACETAYDKLYSNESTSEMVIAFDEIKKQIIADMKRAF